MTLDMVPALRRGVRRHYDTTRNAPVLMAPERVVLLDDIADAIIAECDGQHSVRVIVARLAARYQMQDAEIAPDILAFLEELAEASLLNA